MYFASDLVAVFIRGKCLYFFISYLVPELFVMCKNIYLYVFIYLKGRVVKAFNVSLAWKYSHKKYKEKNFWPETYVLRLFTHWTYTCKTPLL